MLTGAPRAQLTLGGNRFDVTPERWLPDSNFTGPLVMTTMDISSNTFSGARLPELLRARAAQAAQLGCVLIELALN